MTPSLGFEHVLDKLLIDRALRSTDGQQAAIPADGTPQAVRFASDCIFYWIEPTDVQAFLSKSPGGAFDYGIMRRSATATEIECRAARISPLIRLLAAELRPVGAVDKG